MSVEGRVLHDPSTEVPGARRPRPPRRQLHSDSRHPGLTRVTGHLATLLQTQISAAWGSSVLSLPVLRVKTPEAAVWCGQYGGGRDGGVGPPELLVRLEVGPAP